MRTLGYFSGELKYFHIELQAWRGSWKLGFKAKMEDLANRCLGHISMRSQLHGSLLSSLKPARLELKSEVDPVHTMLDYNWMLERGLSKIPKRISERPRFSPPPLRSRIEGSKTLILNLEEISSYLKRDPGHLLKFLAKSLGTLGIKAQEHATLQGSFDRNQLSEWIQNYIKRYVLCTECKKPDTIFIKEGKIVYMKCEACGAKQPVPAL